MTTRRIILAILLVLAAGLYGCAAPQPYSGTGYSQQSYIPPGYANPYTPYMGMHGGRCYYHGFVQPTNDMCLNGTVQTPVQLGQVNGSVRPSGAQARSISGMSPETARMLLDELARRDNPCTAKGRTISTSIGAFIGAVAGAIISRGDERVAVVGALIGAAGGNSEATMSCQAYSDTRLSLMLVLDQYGCSGQVRKTNGVVTDDEICDYRRSYSPGHAAPQIADRNVARPVPTDRAVPQPAAKQQPARRPPALVEIMPPK